jgi:hypothetical protein
MRYLDENSGWSRLLLNIGSSLFDGLCNRGNRANLEVGELSYEGDSFRVLDNPKLPTCEIELIYDQLDPPPDEVYIFNNDDNAVCE